MKDDTGVRISEFLDGELSAKELDQLMADLQQPENQQALKDYARLGHAMRGESDIYSSIDVSQAVAEAIANDKATTTTEQLTDRQIASSGWFNASWFKPAMGAAFASVVAIVTVVVNQNAVNTGEQASIPAVAQQQIAPQNIELVNFARSSAETDDNVAAREELNNYLVNHARSASGSNYQGMVPYVRAVAYEPGQQPDQKK